MRKLTKEDFIFLAVLLLFSFIAASRFFDHTLLFHSAPMGLLQQYEFSQLVYTGYLFVLFLFFALILKKNSFEKRKDIYYLITFLTIFMVPMYLYTDYFGTMDVYAWILAMFSMMLLDMEKAEWLIVILAFVSTLICPMSLFYTICMLTAMLLYKTQKKEKKQYLYLAVGTGIGGVAGVLVTMTMGYFTTDAQQSLSWHKFVLVIMLLSPYMFILFRFWDGIIQRAEEKMKVAYIVLFLGGLPSVFATLYIQDFHRAIFMAFVYYLFVGVQLLSLQDEKANVQMDGIKAMVKEWLPIPAMIIGYPLIILTLWMYGPLQLIVETILGN